MRISWPLSSTVMAFLIMSAVAGDLPRARALGRAYALVATYPRTGEASDKIGKRMTEIFASQNINPVAIQAESVVQVLVPADRAEGARKLLAKSFDAETLTLQHIIRRNNQAQAVGSIVHEFYEQQIIGLPVVATRNEEANAGTIARIDQLFKEHNLGWIGFASADVVWDAPVHDWARARKMISEAIEAEGLPAKLIEPPRLDR